MAQEQQDKAQLPGAGENWADEQEGHTDAPKTDAEHRSDVIALLGAKGLNATRFVEMKFFGGSAAVKPPYKPLLGAWGKLIGSNHETGFTATRWTSGLGAGFINPVTGSQQADSPISSLGAASSNAVQRAQDKLKKAQQELQEALDVERAMLELAQLREVRKLHGELYRPDKDSGQTVAQQYLAFKASQREQSA